MSPLKKILIVDFSGAAITGFMHGLVLPSFPAFFFIPVEFLLIGCLCAITFMTLSAYALFVSPSSEKTVLKYLVYLNILFSISTLITLLIFARTLSRLDWGYFISEIIIIVLLASYELNIYRHAK